MRPWIVPAVCLGWLVGVALGGVREVPAPMLQGALVAAGSVFVLAPAFAKASAGRPAFAAWRSRAGRSARGAPRSDWRIRLGALVLLAGVFGTWRADAARALDAAQRAAWAPVYGHPVVLRGAVTEAQVRGASVRLTIGEVEQDGQRLPGFLRTTVPRAPDLRERATVVLRGVVLRPHQLGPPGGQPRGDPAPGASPRYGASLERVFDRHQVFAAMRFPRVIVEHAGALSPLTRIRERLRAVLLRALPEPAAGLYSAFLLSFDHDLPRDLRDQAAATGILHLVAISGSHIAAIAGFVFWSATVVGCARRAATFLTLGLTLGFLALIGFPESGVRSGIMAAVVLLAYLFGRQGAGLRALLLACALMTFQNPRILLGDVGFQLSALAVWGLLTIFPLLQARLSRLPNPFRLRTVFLLTLSAEIATLPVVAYAFGRVPLLGPLTNLFAAYLFPVLLALGALVLVLGLLAPWGAALLAPVAATAGNAFLAIAEVGSRIPAHAVTVPSFSLAAFLASLVVLVIAVQSFPRPQPAAAHV